MKKELNYDRFYLKNKPDSMPNDFKPQVSKNNLGTEKYFFAYEVFNHFCVRELK